MPMAEGKRGRRAPAGRSTQPKVSQGNKNVLHVNLDVRTGVPRASVVHTKQLQQQQPVVNGGCRTGVGGTPVFSHSQKSHTSSFPHHHYANQNNNNNINNNNNHPGHSYQSPTSHPSRSATSTTTTTSSSTTTFPCHYRESLDEPPKYDEIFNSHVYHMYEGGQQRPQRNYEKKPVKSYFLRHFPKAKTFNKLNSDNNSVNSGLASGLGGSASGRRGCYAEIHIPPAAPSNIGGFTHQPPPKEEAEEVPTTATQPRPQDSLHRHPHPIPQQGAQPPNRKYTITLKPGHYKINVQWRSKTHPFRITLTPNKRGDGDAPPPVEEQPLYYGSCHAHQQYVDQDLNTSLPRRLVHRLLFRQHPPPLECSYSQEQQEVSHQQMRTMPSMTSQLPQYHPHQQVAHHLQLQQQVAQQQHQLLQQQVGVNPAACVGDRKGLKRCWEGGPRHRQRKSRYRWASLSCMHLSSLDDSVGEEASGCDSYGGYEGVEHLKRHSLSHLKAVSAESLSCGCRQGSGGGGIHNANAIRGSSRGMLAVSGRGNVGRGSNNFKRVGGGFGRGGGGGGRGNFINGGRCNVSNFNNIRCGVTPFGFNNRQKTFNNNVLGSGDNSVDDREGVTDDSFVFIEKSQLKYHAVSCDVLPGDNGRADVTVGDYITHFKMAPLSAGERKTWHEDEAFIKQVVEEYFKDPAPLLSSDFDEKESEEKIDIPEKLKSLTPPEVSISIAPKAKEESDLSSSSSSSESSSSSPTSSSSSSSVDDEDGEFLEKELQCGSPSIDDTTYCESDDTNSWYTDDSLGYEADAEPSDKDTLGHVWRRWRSAPDVRQSSDTRMRRMQQLGKLAGAAAAAAASSRRKGGRRGEESDSRGTKASVWYQGGNTGGGENIFGHVGVVGGFSQVPFSTSSPYKQLPVCGYQPRKSCSVDETKLSRLKFGLRKVKKHKLLQFNNHDSSRKSKPAHLVSPLKKSNNSSSNNKNNTNDNDNINRENSFHALNPTHVLSPQEEVEEEEEEFHGTEKLEFVNGKYKAGVNESGYRDVLLCECVRRDVDKVGGLGGETFGGGGGGGGGGGSGCGTSVEGGSVDDSTTERTERVLTQGLVVHHSKADHDPHSILNASVIRNALSILREGISSDLVETTKSSSVSVGERKVPNEQTREDDNKLCGGSIESLNTREHRQSFVAKEGDVGVAVSADVGSVTNDDDAIPVSIGRNAFDTCQPLEQKSDKVSNPVSQSLEDSENMNRTNITIHLTPPLHRRPTQDSPRRSVESTCGVEIPLGSSANIATPRAACNSTINDSDFKAVDGCLPGLRKNSSSSRSERTYENINHPLHPGNQGNVGEKKEHQYDSACNNSKVNNVKYGREVIRPGKRSTSVDSVGRRERESLSRVSTVSSSSETSSCCHARPKSKSKKLQGASHERNRPDGASHIRHEGRGRGVDGGGRGGSGGGGRGIDDVGGGRGGGGGGGEGEGEGGGGVDCITTNSTLTGQVFGNEYHVHRVQVGTGNNRQFAHATQRSVLEVPVSGSEESDSQVKGLQKSELVLEPPSHSYSTLKATLKQDQVPSPPPTFVSESFPKCQPQQMCISEYNIGDAQSLRRQTPESSNRLTQEIKNKQSKRESISCKHKKENDNSNTGGGKKSRKSCGSKSKSRSTPIKYFSGILHAFGSVAPKFRGATTTNNCEGREEEEEKVKKNHKDIERKRSDDDNDTKKNQAKSERKRIDDDDNSDTTKSQVKREIKSKTANNDISSSSALSNNIQSLSSLHRRPEHHKGSTLFPGGVEGMVGGGVGGGGGGGGGGYRKEGGDSPLLTPHTAKSDRLQVRDTKDSLPRGSQCPATVSDVGGPPPPVPSPRPRRAHKNSHESLGNIAPTPPTRRKNVSDSLTKPLFSGSGNELSRGGGGGGRPGQYSLESPRASARAKRGKEPNLHSWEKNPRLAHQSGSQDLLQGRVNSPKIHKSSSLSSPGVKDNIQYENVNFHQKHSFGKSNESLVEKRNKGLERPIPNYNSSTSIGCVLNESDNLPHKTDSKKNRNSIDKKAKSNKRRSIHSNSQNSSISLHSDAKGIPSKSCGSNNGATGSSNGGGGGGADGGGGGGGGGSGGGSGGGGGGSGEMAGNRNTSKDGVSGGGPSGGRRGGGGCGGCGGGHNPGGSGGESSGGASGRRRRVRPPSLPTSPLQSSRPRRHSQTSQTSGGSLPSSPTRWRRPQFEDSWDGLSDEGGREGRRLSRTPSAESVESEATSFYYSAMGSAVYDDPKSVYEDATARYSFVTCPAYEEPPEAPIYSSPSSSSYVLRAQASPAAKAAGSITSIPRTISGDLNCDVDVSLSEGEIKVRVRTEGDEVTSSTPIHDDDDDSDDDESDDESDDDGDDSDSKEDSESHDYEVSRSFKSREESPEILYSASETEVGDEEEEEMVDDEEEDEIQTLDNDDDVKVVDTGVVHAVPCMAGTDSSNWSSLSSSYGKTNDRQNETAPSKPVAGKRESGLVHATPCWATTDSDVRSSVSSTDYFSKVCLSASTEKKIYEPHYENLSPSLGKEKEPLEEKSVSSEPETQRRRLSGVWTTVEESDDESSEWEDETLPANLHQSFSKASIGEGEEEEEEEEEEGRTRSHQDDMTNEYPSLRQDDNGLRDSGVSPRTPSPRFNHHQPGPPTWSDPTGMGFPDLSQPKEVGEEWEQEQRANAWEWHKAVWEHHQKIHEQHLHHLHHHHQQHHQSLFSDVMSCLGGGRWGGGGSGNWCPHSYADPPACGHDFEGSRHPHLQDSPTPDCRWSGQYQEDPPYQPAGATSPGDLGKPPPSPLPPSGSHRSRDTSSVPRDGVRPQSRQRSRSRRRAHSANSKYRVELEIPPHLLTRQRPSSFSSLAARRPSSHSPEPLEEDLDQETLLYLADIAYKHTADANRRRLAERKKNEGNELYKAKDYREALKLYTQAIDLCPDCAAYYSNRSACYMMLGKYHDALNDAREAVRLDNTFVKGYLRVAKCNIALGDANAALSVLRQAGELEPTNRIIRDEMNNAQSLLRCLEEVAKATAKTDYRTAIFHLDRALDQAVGCRNLKITKAEYLVFLQRFADAQEMVNEILQFDSGNADAIYVRGMCLYYQDNPEAAFNHFQHVLRLAPDHQKARDIYKKAKHLKQKKEEGNDAFKRGSFQEAYNLYTDSLAIDPLNKHTNAKLYFNRATVGSKLNKLEQAIEDCTAAINLDEGYVKAYLRRAKCYQTLEKHDEAVRDYEKVARLDRSQEHKRLLHESKIQLKRSKRKDYYKILGVGKTASDDEIKKSYRKMALVHHPDRHASASDKDKREHEIKFKEIGEAYAVLTDAKKRALYDRGQDINDPDGGFGHEADIDPNQIFQAFFGGHGGHGFGAHASFQQGGFPGGGFSGGNFPGGFHFQFG